jgi:glycosyltransferase involved in cell wall biosynthesis
MTASAEAGALEDRTGHPCDADWRAAASRAQVAGMPSGRVVVSCAAPRGVGGLGRHLDEIAGTLERLGQPVACISSSEAESSPPATRRSRRRLGAHVLSGALGALPVPVSPGLRARAFVTEFDADAARRLPPAEHLIAFNSQALRQFRAARRARYQSLALVSANSHVRRLIRQHARAHRQYPLEGSWAAHLVARNLAEYAQAQRVYVASTYIRESFLEQGFPEEKLSDFPLTPDPRYTPREQPPTQGRFEIVYVGSLAVHKGVPLLIDAVRRLPHTDLGLTLVGGWATRGMRRFVQGACAADPRISAQPGDPLPRLRGANLCVHPAFEDGFAYAPAEALASGVPVIVSEDTGMKDLIDSPRRGLVLPTGELGALTEAIDAAYRGETLVG